MREEPKELQVYRHFKGNLYQIITIAVHSETGEKLVIYRPLYDGAANYARPLDMFMSEVDHKKYPDVTQKYRFELLVADEGKDMSEAGADNTSACDAENGEANLDPMLEKFLDASSYKDKLECFYLMKKTATPQILSYVAMSLDIEISKETVEEQYAEILYCLKTMEKYECSRLRP